VHPAPAKSKEQNTPAAQSPTPGTREIINGLSQTDLGEALNLLKANYVNPAALTDLELSRATLQGLITLLAPGVSIMAQPPEIKAESPFRAEVLDDRIGYLRMGSLVKGNIDEMDAALQSFNTKSLKSVVLDLRATPAGSDFDSAAEVIKRFCPKGKLLFTVMKTSAKQERSITSNQDPSFHGLLIVLADRDTMGGGEVIAAVLRNQAKAMIIGQDTAGQAVEYSDLKLTGGKILRVAVAEVVMPGNVSIFPKGVKPDLPVEMTEADKQEVMRVGLGKEGVSPLVFETERTHMNEAALVAGKNPEIDALEAAQRYRFGERTKAPLRDTVLQRAVDLVTTLGVYGNNTVPVDKQQ
jgi:C-terminal processing protease CtpA/Prc